MIYKQTRYLALACLVLGKERLLTARSALFRTGGIPESHTWLGRDKARLSMTPSSTVVLWHRAGCVPMPVQCASALQPRRSLPSIFPKAQDRLNDKIKLLQKVY